MCKEELNQVDEMEEENFEEMTLDDMSKDQLIDVIEQLMTTKEVEVSTDSVQGLEFDEDEFSKGLKSVSYICGMISGLSSVGLNKDQIMDYVVNEQNIKFNKDLNSQTCVSNEKVAKIQQTIAEQNNV